MKDSAEARHEIHSRIKQLRDTLQECEIIINGRDSEFWKVVARTLKAKKESYLQDSYSAAESEQKSIRTFLGRMEAIDWTLGLVETDFLEQAKRIHAELDALANQLKELDLIDESVTNTIDSPVYHNPGTI